MKIAEHFQIKKDRETVEIDIEHYNAFYERLRSKDNEINYLKSLLENKTMKTASIEDFKNHSPYPVLLFELWSGEQMEHVYRLYSNGYVEGFPEGTCLINHAYPILSHLRAIWEKEVQRGLITSSEDDVNG